MQLIIAQPEIPALHLVMIHALLLSFQLGLHENSDGRWWLSRNSCSSNWRHVSCQIVAKERNTTYLKEVRGSNKRHECLH